MRRLAHRLGHRLDGRTHAGQVLRLRHDHHAPAETLQQIDRAAHAERARQHEIGIEPQDILGAAVRDGYAARPLGDGRDAGVGRQMRDGGDALARDKLDHQLVGAQIERDDAARRVRRLPRHGHQRGGHQAKNGKRPPQHAETGSYFAQLPPTPSAPPNVSFRPANAWIGAA